MNLKAPINENYAGVFTIVSQIVKLDNCDNVHHAVVFGHRLIVGKDVQIGSKGIFFPVETQLSEDYLHYNNLYRDNTKNADDTKKGYFEENGRIRCVKFRGHRSEGLFMPLDSLLFAATVADLATINGAESFDHINGIEICRKYIPKTSYTQGNPKTGATGKHPKKVSRLIANQFRFHPDTAQLGKNIHRIKPDTIISITNKLHGTSFVVGKILVNRKLSWFEKLLIKFGVNVNPHKYDMIYSSRKVIKNDDLNKENRHYYNTDVWADVATDLSVHLQDGLTFYGEAVGFTRTGKPIQEGYDYGCSQLYDGTNVNMKIFIYRITFTNVCGDVFEFSAKQVQEFCKERGLNAVPEFFYGKASELQNQITVEDDRFVQLRDEEWQEALLTKLLTSYSMEKDCDLCKTKVPAEGIVLRIESNTYDAYKLKSFRFRERETKQLDKGEVDIETEQSQ